ncbi:DUF4259 domain-containing protein [Kitasatospora sp. NPDC059571]|uniref:DUF4259 domain-containing protein n=1 Tax=Kitasatospora sp. NPDC059571 TaxID=3346871 RepID=UPI0036BF3F94
MAGGQSRPAAAALPRRRPHRPPEQRARALSRRQGPCPAALSAPGATIPARRHKEITTGTWDIGPFENDTAADFAHTLDEAAPDEREGLVRSALAPAAAARGCLDSPEGAEAVAAAALVAGQCPGGEPVAAVHGPDEALPVLASDLRPLAVEALDRAAAADSEPAQLWGETVDGPWRQDISRLRAVLAHPTAQGDPGH